MLCFCSWILEKWEMFRVAFVFIPVLAHVQSSFDVSSFVQTKNNHRLSGCIIKSQRTTGILECAHRCLLHGACDSFNYVTTAVNQGTCELNRHSEGGLYTRNLMHRDGWVFGKLIASESFTFTTLGAAGWEGPQSTSGYLGTSLEGKVQLNEGIQIWNVPQTGMYEIEAWGASGGDGRNTSDSSFVKFGGLGARVRGHFYLRRGTQLRILVGQRGITALTFQHTPGTGGGGSFVTKMNNIALIVAGGGGGGSADVVGAEDGDPGQAGRNGSQNGGVEGAGGRLFNDNVKLYGGAGGGFFEDGEGPVIGPPVKGGQSFMNGGKGGTSSTAEAGKTDGGFGGGGGSVSDPGGGGGYSGGGVTKTKNFCKGGGGGSYNVGTQQLNEAGFNKGDGQVSIKVVN